MIAKDGVSEQCVRYIEGKFFLNHHGWTIKNLDKSILKKYFNFYLLTHQYKIFALARGTAQKGINQENFYQKISIPIPSIAHQKEIIHQMIEKEELICTLQKLINNAKKNIEIIMNTYLKNTIKEPIKKSKKETKSESVEFESSEEKPIKKSKKKVTKSESVEFESESSEEEPIKKSKNKAKSSESESRSEDVSLKKSKNKANINKSKRKVIDI